MENQQPAKKKSPLIWIAVVVILLVGGAAVVYFVMSGDENTNTNQTATDTNTAASTTNTASSNTSGPAEEDSYADLMKYDGTEISIASTDGKVEGSVAIQIDTNEEYPIYVLYFMKVNDPLPKVAPATSELSDDYYYVASHGNADTIRDTGSAGALSMAFCNTDAMPDVLAVADTRSIMLDLYEGCDAQYDPWHEIGTFYYIYATYLNSDTFDYQAITDKDTLAVFDEGDFYIADAETGGWGADLDTVVSQGNIVAQYTLTYTE